MAAFYRLRRLLVTWQRLSKPTKAELDGAISIFSGSCAPDSHITYTAHVPQSARMLGQPQIYGLEIQSLTVVSRVGHREFSENLV